MRLSFARSRHLRSKVDPDVAVSPKVDVDIVMDAPHDVGSIVAHQNRTCVPCLFHTRKVDGCRKGADCSHCHFCSAAEARHRTGEVRVKSEKLVCHVVFGGFNPS